MNRITVARLCLGLFLLLGGLSGCGEEANPLLGHWRGTISETQRQGIELQAALEGDRLEIEFSEDVVTINGKKQPVVYKKSDEHYFVNEIGSNRTMSAIFVDPDTIELRIPHHFKRRLMVFKLIRKPSTQ